MSGGALSGVLGVSTGGWVLGVGLAALVLLGVTGALLRRRDAGPALYSHKNFVELYGERMTDAELADLVAARHDQGIRAWALWREESLRAETWQKVCCTHRGSWEFDICEDCGLAWEELVQRPLFWEADRRRPPFVKWVTLEISAEPS